MKSHLPKFAIDLNDNAKGRGGVWWLRLLHYSGVRSLHRHWNRNHHAAAADAAIQSG